jgi:hypothetical protein
VSTKTPIEDLKFKLVEAQKVVASAFQGSQVVKHIKSGGLYCITNVALVEATLDVVVVYSSFDGTVTFTRPLEDFLEKFRVLGTDENLELTRTSKLPL